MKASPWPTRICRIRPRPASEADRWRPAAVQDLFVPTDLIARHQAKAYRMLCGALSLNAGSDGSAH
jgi:hypothetical protein